MPGFHGGQQQTRADSALADNVTGQRTGPQPTRQHGDDKLAALQAALNSSPAVQRLHAAQERANAQPQVQALQTRQNDLNQPSLGWQSASGALIAGVPAKTGYGGEAGVAQRAIENATMPEADDGHAAAVKEFFATCDSKTDDAYRFAVSVPSLGPYAGLDGYTKLWLEKWQAYLDGQGVNLLAASFGYVVESLVSKRASEFFVGAPAGYTVATQVARGGTRPDLVLMKDGQHVAWLDLTAANSANHIFDKEDWAKHIHNYCEVTYPSIDNATLQIMKANKSNQGALSQADFEKKQAEVTKAYETDKARWKNAGQHFTKKALGAEFVKQIGARDLFNINPELGQNFIRGKLEAYFKVRIDNAGVPSILAAMGVDAGAWGYGIGFTQSVAAGEAWLGSNWPA